MLHFFFSPPVIYNHYYNNVSIIANFNTVLDLLFLFSEYLDEGRCTVQYDVKEGVLKVAVLWLEPALLHLGILRYVSFYRIWACYCFR